jgi:hypothetical protein
VGQGRVALVAAMWLLIGFAGLGFAFRQSIRKMLFVFWTTHGVTCFTQADQGLYYRIRLAQRTRFMREIGAYMLADNRVVLQRRFARYVGTFVASLLDRRSRSPKGGGYACRIQDMRR